MSVGVWRSLLSHSLWSCQLVCDCARVSACVCLRRLGFFLLFLFWRGCVRCVLAAVFYSGSRGLPGVSVWLSLPAWAPSAGSWGSPLSGALCWLLEQLWARSTPTSDQHERWRPEQVSRRRSLGRTRLLRREKKTNLTDSASVNLTIHFCKGQSSKELKLRTSFSLFNITHLTTWEFQDKVKGKVSHTDVFFDDYISAWPWQGETHTQPHGVSWSLQDKISPEAVLTAARSAARTPAAGIRGGNSSSPQKNTHSPTVRTHKLFTALLLWHFPFCSQRWAAAVCRDYCQLFQPVLWLGKLLQVWGSLSLPGSLTMWLQLHSSTLTGQTFTPKKNWQNFCIWSWLASASSCKPLL